jgi:hypothetical protein
MPPTVHLIQTDHYLTTPLTLLASAIIPKGMAGPQRVRMAQPPPGSHGLLRGQERRRELSQDLSEHSLLDPRVTDVRL